MSQTPDFALLGPLAAAIDGEPVDLGGTRTRSVLAALLLDANRVVPLERLVEAAWDEQPPSTARAQAQNRVSMLRRILYRDGRPELIERAGSGYLVRLGDDSLDLSRFRRAVANAESLHGQGDLSGAAGGLAKALALWRGPALDGLTTPYLQAAARKLEEQRLGALERRVELDLALGRHAEVVPELTDLAQANPYHERLHALLMLALYRAGRPTEALDAFRRTRAVLTEQLGVEPSPLLQRLQQAVLQVDDRLMSGSLDELAAAPAPPAAPTATIAPSPQRIPRELPAVVAGFVGRAEQLSTLDKLMRGDPDVAGVIVIAGTAGVGKTVLAVQWAHQIADRFPDGQLYLNLRGYSQDSRMSAIEALAALLRSLGTRADQVPVDTDEASAMYRSLLADRRVLVVLDNAGSVDQVRPLLPGGPGCLVVVTARDRLGGLLAREGAARLELPVLTPDETRQLLARVLGAERLATEPDAAGELSELCAGLPLALRIVAANLHNHPRHRLADHVARLRDGNRLATLSVEGDPDAAVGPAFGLSYRSIPAPAQRMFRLMGLAPGVDVAVPAAAALAGVTREVAARLLDKLANAYLIDEHAPGRYTFHDLLRQYAADVAETTDSQASRVAAVERLTEHRVGTAGAAADVLYPRLLRLPRPDLGADADPVAFRDRGEALAWLDDERTNLTATVLHAAAHGPRPMAWQLADALRGYFYFQMHFVDWLESTGAALGAARAEADRRAEAALEMSLATLRFRHADYPACIEHGTASLALARAIDWPEAQAAALILVGLAHWQSGDLPAATDAYQEALDSQRMRGDLARLPPTLTNLGLVHWQRGQLRQAAEFHTEAVRVYRLDGTDYPIGLTNLGRALHDLGESGAARRHLTDALAQHRDAGDRGAEAYTCHTLATLHLDTGRTEDALELARSAVRLARETDNRYDGATALNVLASVHTRLGERAAAIELHQQVLDLTRETGIHYADAVALIGLAHAYRPERPDAAFASATRALELARRYGYRVLEGHALLALAAVIGDRGQAAAAARHTEAALALYSETGYRAGTIDTGPPVAGDR